jgi:hypothetical protein
VVPKAADLFLPKSDPYEKKRGVSVLIRLEITSCEEKEAFIAVSKSFYAGVHDYRAPLRGAWGTLGNFSQRSFLCEQPP